MQYSTGRAFGWLLYRSGLLGELLIVHTQLSIILYYSECSSSQWEASFKCIGTGVYFNTSSNCIQYPKCKILKISQQMVQWMKIDDHESDLSYPLYVIQKEPTVWYLQERVK